MKSFRFYVTMVAIMGLSVPHVATAAQPPILAPSNARATRDIVKDVALRQDSKLAIQIVDPQGKPHAGTPIHVRKAGTTVHKSVAGKAGYVVLSGLKPGIYEVTSGSRGGIYRLWAPQTAPPQASDGILLIDDGGIVRGVQGGWHKAAIIGGVIITAGTLGGVIGYNIKDDAS